MLKGFIPRPKFICLPPALIRLLSVGIRTLRHLNHISAVSLSDPICRDSLSAGGCALGIYLSLSLSFSTPRFRVKTCTRPTKTCLRRTSPKFCSGRGSWRKPKPRARRCFQPLRVSKLAETETHSLHNCRGFNYRDLLEATLWVEYGCCLNPDLFVSSFLQVFRFNPSI